MTMLLCYTTGLKGFFYGFSHFEFSQSVCFGINDLQSYNIKVHSKGRFFFFKNYNKRLVWTTNDVPVFVISQR